MKRKSSVKQILVIFLTLILISLMPSCSQEKSKPLTVGTGAPGGSYYLTGLAISSIVNNREEALGFRLQQLSSSGSVSNINAIMAGDIDLGIAQADRLYQAYNGLGEWKEQGTQEDLRAIFSLYTEAVTLVAGRDSGINTIDDLRGKRVDIGLPGSGTRQNAIDVFDAADMEWEKDIEVHEEKLDERINMLIHSKLDAFFHTVGHPSKNIKFATYSVRGARLIPLDNIEKILSAKPYYSRSYIPAGLYPLADNKSDVETIGVKAVFLASAKVPEDIVYAITKAVFEDFDALAEHAPILKTIRKENMLDGITAPIHPGALRYYKEAGLQVPASDL